jgi:hypothetical protein
MGPRDRGTSPIPARREPGPSHKTRERDSEHGELRSRSLPPRFTGYVGRTQRGRGQRDTESREIGPRSGRFSSGIVEHLGHENPAFPMKQYAYVVPGMQAS